MFSWLKHNIQPSDALIVKVDKCGFMVNGQVNRNFFKINDIHLNCKGGHVFTKKIIDLLVSLH